MSTHANVRLDDHAAKLVSRAKEMLCYHEADRAPSVDDVLKLVKDLAEMVVMLAVFVEEVK